MAKDKNSLAAVTEQIEKLYDEINLVDSDDEDIPF